MREEIGGVPLGLSRDYDQLPLTDLSVSCGARLAAGCTRMPCA